MNVKNIIKMIRQLIDGMDGIDTESATIAMDFGIDDSLCSIVVYDSWDQ